MRERTWEHQIGEASGSDERPERPLTPLERALAGLQEVYSELSEYGLQLWMAVLSPYPQSECVAAIVDLLNDPPIDNETGRRVKLEPYHVKQVIAERRRAARAREEAEYRERESSRLLTEPGPTEEEYQEFRSKMQAVLDRMGKMAADRKEAEIERLKQAARERQKGQEAIEHAE